MSDSEKERKFQEILNRRVQIATEPQKGEPPFDRRGQCAKALGREVEPWEIDFWLREVWLRFAKANGYKSANEVRGALGDSADRKFDKFLADGVADGLWKEIP